jgi:hypothetical protein
MLARLGQVLSAQGFWQLAAALSNHKNERTLQALAELSQERTHPMVLRQPHTLLECPPNVTWRIEFEAAMREIFNGKWRRGVNQLDSMSKRILDAPAILYNLGLVRGWLWENDLAVKSLRAYAQIRDVPLDDRVEAAALAEYLDERQGLQRVDLLAWNYELSDLESFFEKCQSNRQLIAENVEAVPTSDEPPPRAGFSVYDRPPPTGADVQPDDLPEKIGAIYLFGRQTDRAPRLMMVGTRQQLPILEQICRQMVDGSLGDVREERMLARVDRIVAVLLGTWWLPDEPVPDARQQLLRARQARALMERWPITPSPLFDGKTPTEAAADSRWHVTILANILNLDLLTEQVHIKIDADGLRQRLNLPLPKTIEPDTDLLERLPAYRFSRLDVSALTDEQLLTVYRRSYLVAAGEPLRRAALEVTQRPSLDDSIDKVEAFDILSDLSPSTDEALLYLDQARKLATLEGESPAEWLIDELDIRLRRAEFEKCMQLVKEIQTRYMKEPGVEEGVVAVFARYGLVTPDGRVLMPTPQKSAVGVESSAGGSALWTPDSEVEPVVSSEPKSESKLWLPGMD